MYNNSIRGSCLWIMLYFSQTVLLCRNKPFFVAAPGDASTAVVFMFWNIFKVHLFSFWSPQHVLASFSTSWAAKLKYPTRGLQSDTNFFFFFWSPLELYRRNRFSKNMHFSVIIIQCLDLRTAYLLEWLYTESWAYTKVMQTFPDFERLWNWYMKRITKVPCTEPLLRQHIWEHLVSNLNMEVDIHLAI